jgi:hypothetical protein
MLLDVEMRRLHGAIAPIVGIMTRLAAMQPGNENAIAVWRIPAAPQKVILPAVFWPRGSGEHRQERASVPNFKQLDFHYYIPFSVSRFAS